MNNQQEQEPFLKELDAVRKNFYLKNEHIDYLKTIDPDNDSRAIRLLIERDMKHTKMQKLQQGLLYLVFGMCLITLAILILPLI